MSNHYHLILKLAPGQMAELADDDIINRWCALFKDPLLVQQYLTGKFWESRFNSQAPKNDEALLSGMVYVDLNPVRAKMARTPEDSEHTSIQERISSQFDLAEAIKSQCDNGDLLDYQTPLKPLLHFDENITTGVQNGIPFRWEEYLELVDSTGRLLLANKRGSIDYRLPPILERMQITAEQWLINARQFESIHARRFNRIEPAFSTG